MDVVKSRILLCIHKLSEWVKLLSIYCAKLRLKEFTPINRDAAVQMLGTLIETFSRRKAENVALLASFADLFNPAKRYAAERDGQDERYTAYPVVEGPRPHFVPLFRPLIDGGACLVAVAIPLFVVAVAREQISVARSWAKRLDEGVGLDRLLRMSVLPHQ